MSCDEEKDEDEECHTMVKDNKSSAVATNEKNTRKVIECCVDESDHKEACKVAECEVDFKK